MKKVLITGSTGFVGSHLIDYILDNQPDVDLIVCAKRTKSNMDNVKHLTTKTKIKFVDVELEDSKSVDALFTVFGEFDKCFHLAAQSFVKLSFDSPAETLTTNVIGTINLLEAIRKFNKECVILISGSSDEYGIHNEIIDENTYLRPLSPYAVSKVAQENLGHQYFKSYGLKTILTRTFNHDGPRRADVFVTSSFAKQIAEIEKGGKEAVIHHGNLDSYRDFTDVRDVVRAYWLASEKCENGEPYNICSGEVTKIDDVLNKLLSFSTIKIEKKQDPNRMRPSDIMRLEGKNDKFKKATGWNIEISVDKMLEDLLNYWRERV